MTATLTAKVVATIGFVAAGAPNSGTSQYNVDPDLSGNSYSTGSGSGQVSSCFSDKRQLSASASETLDLYGGLTDALGRTDNFTNVKAIEIIADKANGSTIVIGNAASHPFLAGLGGTTPTVTLPAGGKLLLENPAGWAITDSTNDALKIANSDGANPATYHIRIIG